MASPSVAIQPEAIAESAFSRYAYRGARRIGYGTLDDLHDRIVEAVDGAQGGFVYAYAPQFDTAAHRHGCRHPEPGRVISDFQKLFERLCESLARREALLLATADHGFVDIAPERQLTLGDHPALEALLARPLVGEPRVAFAEPLPGALADTANWTQLSPQQDIANLGSSANLKQIYLLRGPDEQVKLVILPVSGTGYGGPIEAMVAVADDMNTVAGLTVLSHGETPGLGARITEPAWRQQFSGKRIADDTGAVRLTVARGGGSSEFEVDAITGATRTSTAMANMLQFWLGPQGYGPLLQAIRRGEF